MQYETYLQQESLHLYLRQQLTQGLQPYNIVPVFQNIYYCWSLACKKKTSEYILTWAIASLQTPEVPIRVQQKKIIKEKKHKVAKFVQT